MTTEKQITIGIPAFKAEEHIGDCLASIQIQTLRDNIEVIIAKDNPTDNYDFLYDRYPDLDITILDCEKNTGPGLARQRCLDAATTDWITFIDADDVFMGPFAIESLRGGIGPNVIEVQGTFFQEIENHPQGIRMMPKTGPGLPWVFAKLYNVRFLRDKKITFSDLRAMEDGEFNWMIRLTVENSPLIINIIDAPIYLWRKGSEHSITRIGADDEDGIPQYNFDLCLYGSTIAAINAINFARRTNPFNGSILQFTVEMMVGQYFSYIECLERKPIFAEQNLYNAKKFYHEAYKLVENQISDEVLKNMYTIQMAQKSQDLIGIIPQITFFDFMNKIKSESYGGDNEFKRIRAALPDYIIERDLKTGVLGAN